MAVLGIRSLLTTLLLISISHSALSAEPLFLSENKIKAGLVYNFLKYTQWPSADPTSTSITVCILDEDPFDGLLGPISGRTVNHRTIAVNNMEEWNATSLCHMLIIHADRRNDWPELRKKLSNRDILTVSDFNGFAEQGGMIEFSKENDRVHVEVNLEAVTKAELQIDNSLLNLTTIISSSPAPEGDE